MLVLVARGVLLSIVLVLERVDVFERRLSFRDVARALGCSLRTKSSTPTCPEGIGGRARLAAAEVDAFAFAVRPLSTFRLASAAIPFPTRERRRSSSGESSSSGMGTAGLATR